MLPPALQIPLLGRSKTNMLDYNRSIVDLSTVCALRQVCIPANRCKSTLVLLQLDLEQAV